MTDAPPTTSRPGAPAPAPPPRKGLRHGARAVAEWVLILAGALLVAFVVKTFLIQAFYIPSGSMEPQLNINDRVLVNKLSYRLHEVHRGDIIVFERPMCSGGRAEVKDLIKRVIAVPGETVEGRDGRVFINDAALDEPYLPLGSVTADFSKETVPPDSYWVMGDNRGNSRDSRVLCGGPTFIPEDLIVGRAFIRIYPVGDFGLL